MRLSGKRKIFDYIFLLPNDISTILNGLHSTVYIQGEIETYSLRKLNFFHVGQQYFLNNFQTKNNLYTGG